MCPTPQPGAGEQGVRDTARYLLFGVSWGLQSHGSLLRRKMLIILFLLKSLGVHAPEDTLLVFPPSSDGDHGRGVWRSKCTQMSAFQMFFHSFHHNGKSTRKGNLYCWVHQ